MTAPSTPPTRQSLPAVSPFDARFLEMAARAADREEASIRFGAVLVRRGRVLTIASAPLMLTPNGRPPTPTTALWREHAEFRALNLLNRAHPTALYVVRISAAGTWQQARPCLACWMAAREHGVVRVVYSLDDGAAIEQAHTAGWLTRLTAAGGRARR